MRMPGKIFSVYFRIIYCHILSIPEGILGIDDSIAYLHIAAILE